MISEQKADQYPVTFFNIATGEINSTASLSPPTYKWYKEQEIPLLDGKFDPKLYYVVNKEAISRPENLATILNQKLSNLPIPNTIQINGKIYENLEPTATLEFSHLGTYSVIVRCFPYQDKTFEITV